MPYYIKNFRREKDHRTVGELGVIIEAETRDKMYQKVREYFGVDDKVPRYSGHEVCIEVFEDDFGFRVDSKDGRELVTYVGVLEYSGTVCWHDAERAIIITGSESSR